MQRVLVQRGMRGAHMRVCVCCKAPRARSVKHACAPRFTSLHLASYTVQYVDCMFVDSSESSEGLLDTRLTRDLAKIPKLEVGRGCADGSRIVLAILWLLVARHIRGGCRAGPMSCLPLVSVLIWLLHSILPNIAACTGAGGVDAQRG